MVGMADIAVARSVEELRERVDQWRRGSASRVALVPTMGALHDGHLALIHRARQIADRVVVSIFVNPTQFGVGEDFDTYPRTEDRDLALLAEVGGDLAYCPSAQSMYPEGFATTISVSGPARGLCAATRPQLFDGVALVCTKLCLQCRPDVAVFGEKDYQQVQVLRRLVADLDIPVVIESVATVREPDGLAMSSRNAYLDAGDRGRAASLYAVLARTAEALSRHPDPPVEAIVDQARASLDGIFDAVDYCVLRDADTLTPVTALTRAARLLAAVHVGGTRLIDNVAVDPPDGSQEG